MYNGSSGLPSTSLLEVTGITRELISRNWNYNITGNSVCVCVGGGGGGALSRPHYHIEGERVPPPPPPPPPIIVGAYLGTCYKLILDTRTAQRQGNAHEWTHSTGHQWKHVGSELRAS